MNLLTTLVNWTESLKLSLVLNFSRTCPFSKIGEYDFSSRGFIQCCLKKIHVDDWLANRARRPQALIELIAYIRMSIHRGRQNRIL